MAEPQAASQPAPVQCAVPPGLVEILEEFSTEVLLQKPENIYCFLAEYCEAKLKGLIPGRGNGGQAGGQALPKPILKHLEDQGQLLENLRAEICVSMQRDGGGQGQGQGQGQQHEGPPRACIKDKIYNVLGQAVELVNMLEQLKNAPECQEKEPAPNIQDQSQVQGICNEIHCLVKYMDQLSQQFDHALGNANCPYHAGNWMPNCSGGGFMDQNGQWIMAGSQLPGAPNGFEIGAQIPQGMIYVAPDASCAYVDPCFDPCDAGNIPLVAPQQAYQQPPEYVFPGCVEAGAQQAQNGTPVQNAPGQAAPGQAAPGQAAPGQDAPGQAAPGQTPPKDNPSKVAQVAAAASAGLAAISESVSNLFGADNEKGFESTVRAINSNIPHVWAISGAAATGEWSSIIQDFLANQLIIIQKLLTGQMPLSDAPYEVAFLTVSFIVGVIVGYRQLSGGATVDGSSVGVTAGNAWPQNGNVVFIDTAVSKAPYCGI